MYNVVAWVINWEIRGANERQCLGQRIFLILHLPNLFTFSLEKKNGEYLILSTLRKLNWLIDVKSHFFFSIYIKINIFNLLIILIFLNFNKNLTGIFSKKFKLFSNMLNLLMQFEPCIKYYYKIVLLYTFNWLV